MDCVSFIDIDETEADLVLSFAINNGNGYEKSYILQRCLLTDQILPEELRGTTVGDSAAEYSDDDHKNKLEVITLQNTLIHIKARFTEHKLDIRQLDKQDIKLIKTALKRHNFDNHFKIKIKMD